MSFIELLLTTDCLPFSLSVALFLFITVVEIILMWIGVGGDFGVDLSLDVDVPTSPDLGGSWLFDWLGVGRVPYLVSIACFLLSFGMLGLFTQTLQLEVLKTAAPWPFVALGATLLSLPIVRLVNLSLGRIWPRDVESSAVTQESLIGLQGTIILGTATATDPGQIKVRDPKGTTHYGLAICEVESERLGVGDAIMIVGRKQSLYRIIRHPNPFPAEL